MQLSFFIIVGCVILETQCIYDYLRSWRNFTFLWGCRVAMNENNFLCIYNQIHLGDLRAAIDGVQKLTSGMFENRSLYCLDLERRCRMDL